MHKRIQHILLILVCIILSPRIFAEAAPTTCHVLVNTKQVLSALTPGMTVDQVVAALGPQFSKPAYVALRYQWTSSDPKNTKVYTFTSNDDAVTAMLGDDEPTEDEVNAMNNDEKKFIKLLNESLDTNNYKKLPLSVAATLLPSLKPAGNSYFYTFPDDRSEFIILVFDANNKLVTSGSNCELPEDMLPKTAKKPAPAAAAPAPKPAPKPAPAPLSPVATAPVSAPAPGAMPTVAPVTEESPAP